MWSWEGMPGYGMMFFGPFMMIIVLVTVVVVAVFLVRYLGGGGSFDAAGKTPIDILKGGFSAGSAPPDRAAGNAALDILKERFAKGEIDKEEFEERRRALGE